MIELNYSKKQLKPIIEKYGIDVENNKNFHNIILMFNGQTNYQIWALKLFFNNICSLDVLNRINQWAIENQTDIKNLMRQNIVSYTKGEELQGLFNEMRGLDLLRKIREGASWFNTSQRKLIIDSLTKDINGTAYNGLQAFSIASTLGVWEKLFEDIKRLPKTRRDKMISLSSALYNLNDLKKHIESSLTATYEWNREDMLSYMERNTPDCKVVFDENNVVVLNVPSFKSSQALCGKGRTCWCLTREDRYFRQYVTDTGSKQYFLFNFNRREDHELAHIGFTVHKTNGITNAHSTRNNSMCGSGVLIDGKRINVQEALKQCNIPLSAYITLKPLKYSWDKASVLKMIAANKNHLALSYDKNNRLIINILTDTGINLLIGHSLINNSYYSGNSSQKKLYVILDFNVDYTNDKSCVLLRYVNNRYGTMSLQYMIDVYNTQMNDNREDYWESINVSQDEFINMEAIDPNIMLHKLINEKKEKDAVKLINTTKNLNVNHEFESNLPVFAAIENNLFNIFEAIINHSSYNSAITNGYGSSVFQSLLFAYDTNQKPSSQHNQDVKHLINMMLDCKNIDFNVQDINAETALSIVCSIPQLLWVVERLINNPSVNVNTVDDFNFTPLGSAINCQNYDAIKLLGQRKDLIIRKCDVENAQKHGFDLYSLISPNTNSEENLICPDMDLSDIFAQAFGCL